MSNYLPMGVGGYPDMCHARIGTSYGLRSCTGSRDSTGPQGGGLSLSVTKDTGRLEPNGHKGYWPVTSQERPWSQTLIPQWNTMITSESFERQREATPRRRQNGGYLVSALKALLLMAALEGRLLGI